MVWYGMIWHGTAVEENQGCRLQSSRTNQSGENRGQSWYKVAGRNTQGSCRTSVTSATFPQAVQPPPLAKPMQPLDTSTPTLRKQTVYRCIPPRKMSSSARTVAVAYLLQSRCQYAFHSLVQSPHPCVQVAAASQRHVVDNFLQQQEQCGDSHVKYSDIRSS